MEGTLIIKNFGINEYFQDDSYIEFHEQVVTIIYKEGKFSIVLEGIPNELIGDFVVDTIYEISQNLLEMKEELTSEIIKNNFELLRANARLSLYVPAERNIAGNLSNVLASMLVAKIPMPNTIIEYLGALIFFPY